MGSHDEGKAHDQRALVDNLETLNLQAWNIADGAAVAIWGSYRLPEGVQSRSLGSINLPYQLLSLPSLGQVLWTLGDEVRTAYRKLTPPQ